MKLIIKTLLFLQLLITTCSFGQGVGFHWIGGSGNWSDTLHWSSVNSGTPTLYDSVFFNANSFGQTDEIVTIDVEAFCYYMDWSASGFEPTLDGNQNLNIYGSIVLIDEMNFDFLGNIYFQTSEENQIINTSSQDLKSNVFFEGTGMWDLQNVLNVNYKTIYFNSGTLITNGNNLSCGSFISDTDIERNLYLGSSDICIKLFNGNWQVNDQLNLYSESSTITFTHPSFESTNSFTGGNLVYNNVIFNNNALIFDGNTFNNLHLFPQHYYYLESNKSQIIIGEIFAKGCSGLIEISSTGNEQATIGKDNGDINLSFVTLKNINAIMLGGYQLKAFHSIDVGNNSGCTITTDARNMYWVNGTGEWTDTTHWSSLPEGPDAKCLPVLYDNVFFDDSSFEENDTVIVDVPELYCNDISWIASKPSLFWSPQQNLDIEIFGSLELNQNVAFGFDGRFNMKSPLNGQSVITNKKILSNDLIFNGIGSWKLEDSLKSLGSINLIRGNLDASNNYIMCTTFHSDSSNFRELNLENSTVEITSYSPYPSWSVNSEDLTLNSEMSNIILQANSSAFVNTGEDTIQYNNVDFIGTYGTARIKTHNNAYVKFNDVNFSSNAVIYSNNSFNTLNLTPGSCYEFQANKTQTIDNILSSGTCEGPILLKSYTNGIKAYIQKNNDTLHLDHSSIRDIYVSGGAYFKADNSIDLGNNEGWDEINEVIAGKLFWVNGTGNWSDPIHWSETSGGEGGACIPTPKDTVIFDQNSFLQASDKVNIDLNNALSSTMDWSAASFVPEFSGASSAFNLRIFGSLIFSPNMDFTFLGSIHFESSNPGEFIITNGVKLHNSNNNVIFNGVGGEWTLSDSLDLGFDDYQKNTILFSNGAINTNGQSIICYDFKSRNSYHRILNLSNAKFTIKNNWDVLGKNLQILENSSIIKIDSGNFLHENGELAIYNDIELLKEDSYQSMVINSVDSILFNKISYSGDGEVSGAESHIIAESIHFNNKGKINNSTESNVNVVTVDSLVFNSVGEVYGNDTCGYVKFDSSGFINGQSVFENTEFNNSGIIRGNNWFGDLKFSPGYSYQLEDEGVQVINNDFIAIGNNCESIWISSTGNTQAEIYKETGEVYCDFIEMSDIIASGDAIFDAGYFSTDINNSNTGWIFHDNPFKYNLGADTSILEGDTIYLCATNFNGNIGTEYEWFNITSGETVGNDSCLMVTERGYYVLTVYYDEGPGCVKQDTIFVGCYLDLLFENTDISCNGFSDGSIEMEIEIGIPPFDINWYYDDGVVGNTEDIYDLVAGIYSFSIEDSEGCISYGDIELFEPDTLIIALEAIDACHGLNTGKASVLISGGTEPYLLDWSTGDSDTLIVDLSPGEYSVTVIDANQCPPLEGSILISELADIKFDLEGIDLNCFEDNSGSIEIMNLDGGIGIFNDFLWLKNGDFFSSEEIQNSLNTGVYNLIITDTLGCQGMNSFTINQPDQIQITLEGTDGTLEFGSISMSVQGGIAPYDYLWNNGATSKDIDPAAGGTYVVHVTDENNCVKVDSIFIEVHYRVYAPTGFTPNGDALNEEFIIHGIGTDLEEYDLTIFSRWGQTVFHTTDPHENWNGKINNTGEVLQNDTYIWQIVITYLSGAKVVDKGNVTLLQ